MTDFRWSGVSLSAVRVPIRPVPANRVTRSRVRPLALTAAAVALIAAVGCSADTGSPPDVGQPIPAESASPAGDSPASGEPTTEATPDDAEADPAPLGAPSALEFAGVRSPVVSVGADEAAALEIPGDIDTVGWWQDGAEPGSPEGFVVITGHATQQGNAAANAWWDAEPGDRVVLEAEHGTATYRVISRRSYADEDIPLARWFPADGPSGPAGLALITCTDYRDGEWRSNLVVEAVPE